MKKNFKLFSATLGMMALASCVNDDIPGLTSGKEVDLSDKVVLEVKVKGLEDGYDTRALMTENLKSIRFEEGDELKVYESQMLYSDPFAYLKTANDTYYFVNTRESGESGVGTREDGLLNYTYAIFGNGNISRRSGLDDLTYDRYGIVGIEDITYSEQEVTTESGDVAYYKSAVPMYGTVTPKVGEPITQNSENPRESFETTLEPMTGLFAARFHGAAGVAKVRARSLTYPEGNDKESFEENLMKNLGVEDATEISSALNSRYRTNTYNETTLFGELQANAEAPLKGWFEVILEQGKWNKGKETGTLYATDDPELAKVEKPEELIVEIPANSIEMTTNVVFFPLIAQHYDVLLVDYQEKGSEEWKFLACVRDREVKRTDKPLSATIERAIDFDNITIPGKNTTDGHNEILGLESLLEKYAGETGNVTLNITSAVTVSDGGNSTDADYYHILNVPALKGKITLNLAGGVRTPDGQSVPLTVTGNVGEGSLTIKTVDKTFKASIDINEYKGKLALVGGSSAWNEDYSNKLHVNMTEGELNLENLNLNDATLEVKRVPELVLGTVKFPRYSTTLNLNEAGTTMVTVNGALSTHDGNTFEILAENADVAVNAVNDGLSVTATNVEVAEEATAATVNATGAVEAKGLVANVNLTEEKNTTQNYANIYKGQSTAYSATKVNITTNGGKVTIDAHNVDETGTDNIHYINSVVMNAPAEIRLTNGWLAMLGRNYDVNKKTAVKTVYANGGLSALAKLAKNERTAWGGNNWIDVTPIEELEDETTKEWIKFSSTWNGQSKALPSDWTNYRWKKGDVYTATQLLALNELTGDNVNLWAEINMQNKAFTQELVLRKSFNGNGHNITNLRLTPSEEHTENFGLFAEIDASNAAITVEDLTLAVTTNFGKTAVNNVGTLAGNVYSGYNRPVSVKNVTVKAGSSLKTPGRSYNVGGLVGYVSTATSGRFSVEGTLVNLSEIAGWYNLGGTVGKVAGNVTVVTSPNNIGAFNVYDVTEAEGLSLVVNEIDGVKVPQIAPVEFGTDGTTVTGTVEDNVDDTHLRSAYGRVGMVIGSVAGNNMEITLGETNYGKDLWLAGTNLRSTFSQKKSLHFDYNYYTTNISETYYFSGGLSAVGYSPALGLGENNTVTYVGTEYNGGQINNYISDYNDHKSVKARR